MAIPFTSIAFSFFQGALPCLSQIASQYSCGLNDVDIMILYVQNQTTEVFLGCALQKGYLLCKGDIKNSVYHIVGTQHNSK